MVTQGGSSREWQDKWVMTGVEGGVRDVVAIEPVAGLLINKKRYVALL